MFVTATQTSSILGISLCTFHRWHHNRKIAAFVHRVMLSIMIIITKKNSGIQNTSTDKLIRISMTIFCYNIYKCIWIENIGGRGRSRARIIAYRLNLRNAHMNIQYHLSSYPPIRPAIRLEIT
uniref:Uncharacterized protein n=1 Tax=Rhizophagus irregularis (strain DAOM 181602 / DAOM 197198 / MUCL 43194) TaxID=747089 RepID=U9TQP2_RHIID